MSRQASSREEHQGAPSDQEALCCVVWDRAAAGTLMKRQGGAESQATLGLCNNYGRKGEGELN